MFEEEFDKRIQILSDYYEITDLLEQNDVEEYIIVKWLVDEGMVDLDDYFFDDDIDTGESD